MSLMQVVSYAFQKLIHERKRVAAAVFLQYYCSAPEMLLPCCDTVTLMVFTHYSSMEQSPSGEVDNSSAAQGIPRIVWDPKI